MSTPAYRLFLRQWKRGHAQESHLTMAVDRGLISQEEKTEIMEQEQDA